MSSHPARLRLAPLFRVLRVSFLLLSALLVCGTGRPAQANWLFQYIPNQVTLDSGKRNNVFLVGDPVQFSLTIFNYGTYTLQGTVRYEVRDYWGNVAASGTVPAPTPNGPTQLALPTITQPGWYKLYLHQATSVAPWGDSIGGTMFVIFRPNPNFPAEPSETLPGNSGGSDGGDEVARGVLGIGPQRHPVSDASQPAAAIASLGPAIAQDKQYYTPFDPQRPRPLLIAFPNGVASSDPAQQAKNLAGLTQIVTQFHSDVKYWEPRNEPQSAYSGADYVNKELKPFYQTIKAVDPTCKILGPAVVTIGPGGLSWVEDFLKAGGGQYIDGFSFHAYNNVNGDLTLARESLDALNALLTKYGLGSIEKWQTEQGYFAACYGAYQPRLQGRWTMLQMMVYEQYGIPKEHNHLWYDKSHGFWDFPAFWENEDGLYSYGSFDPAAPLMRVWSEELYGTNFTSAYNLGALGNKLYVGSLFGGPGKQVAAFQSAGRTDGSLTLTVSSGASIHVVSAFGVASDVPVTNGQAVLPVPELPVYVELAAGQTVQPVPVDYGADLALTPGTVATSSGTGLSPLNPSYPNNISKIINGTLENWYYSQGPGDHPWMGNDASFPAWVQVTLPQPLVISHAVVYAGVPWQSDGSLLDYELQYDQNGQWVTLAHPQEPANVVDFFTPTVFCTADSFYSDRDVFVHDFAPVTTQKIRLLVHNVTFGGGPTQDIVTAGGQTGPQQITLREIELYGPSGQTILPAAVPGTARFFPRVGSPDRMVGGQFQGSADGTNYTTLAAITVLPADNQWTSLPLSADPKTYRYLRYLSPDGSYGNIAELQWYSGAGASAVQLSGTPFGSPGAFYNNPTATFDKAFDGDTTTCVDAPTPNGNFVGIDQDGQAAVPASGTGTIRFYPRVGSANRMQGGKFQGSADGVTYTDLYTITGVPADSQWTSVSLSADPKPYRYLRYLSPNGGWGNVSEIEFYSGTGTSAVKLTGTPFGSPGSYDNDGSTFDKAFDGDTTTCFDGPGPDGNFTGIDQGPASAPVPALTPVYQINAGGSAAGTFAADQFFQGGRTYTASAPIDVSAAADPAPQGVYQSERYGNFKYTLPGLTPGASYTLRLHFAEIYWSAAGQRIFNVAVNGTAVLSNFDIFAASGGANKAVEKVFTATADSTGAVTVAFSTVKDNAKLSGLELLH